MPIHGTSERVEASRRYYLRHREEILEKSRKRRESGAAALASRNHRARLQAVADAAKDVPCTDCGIEFPSSVMDFDHVRGIKTGNIARMIKDGLAVDRLLAEIAKCEVRCATCHRLRHALAA